MPNCVPIERGPNRWGWTGGLAAGKWFSDLGPQQMHAATRGMTEVLEGRVFYYLPTTYYLLPTSYCLLIVER